MATVRRLPVLRYTIYLEGGPAGLPFETLTRLLPEGGRGWRRESRRSGPKAAPAADGWYWATPPRVFTNQEADEAAKDLEPLRRVAKQLREVLAAIDAVAIVTVDLTCEHGVDLIVPTDWIVDLGAELRLCVSRE